MRLPETDKMNRWGFRLLGGFALLMAVAAVYAILRPEPVAEPGGVVPVAVRPASRPVPTPLEAPRLAAPVAVRQPSAVTRNPEGLIVTPEQQTDAIREAVVRDTVGIICLAAARGDKATVKGLVPALKNQPGLSARLLKAAIGRETDDKAQAVLKEVIAQLD